MRQVFCKSQYLVEVNFLLKLISFRSLNLVEVNISSRSHFLAEVSKKLFSSHSFGKNFVKFLQNFLSNLVILQKNYRMFFIQNMWVLAEIKKKQSDSSKTDQKRQIVKTIANGVFYQMCKTIGQKYWFSLIEKT